MFFQQFDRFLKRGFVRWVVGDVCIFVGIDLVIIKLSGFDLTGFEVAPFGIAIAGRAD